MCVESFSGSARLSGVMILLLQLVLLSAVYCKLCPTGCVCVFNEYRCANGTVALRLGTTFMTIACKDTNIACSDLPRMELQYISTSVENCSSNILPCISDPFGLDQHMVWNMELFHMRDPLKDEHVRDLKHMKKLRMSIDRVAPIPVAAINSLKYLKIFKLIRGKLEVSSDRFNNTSLQEVYLDESNMNSVDTEIFNGLPNLKVLHLYNVKIENISESFFRGLTSLERLTLLRNDLKYLETRVFNYTPKLRELEIINNPLEVIPHNLIDGLTRLQKLRIECSEEKDVNETKLNFGVRSFSQLPALKTVLIRNCVLQTPAIQNITDVTVTAEYGSRMNDFSPIVLTNLASLKKLQLPSNYIYELSAAMFTNVTALKTLSLEDNKIKDLHKNLFESLTSLVSLDLSKNNIKVLHKGIFSNLSSLLDLTLSYNFIEELTLDVFVGLDNLKELNLGNNNIMMIEVSGDDICTMSPFRHLPKLQRLDLRNNKVSRLCDSLFSEMRHIVELNLVNNRFRDIWDFRSIYSISHNIVINLNGNNITEVALDPRIDTQKQDYTASIPINRVIYLNRNPIFCDCSNYGLFLHAKSIRGFNELHFILVTSKCTGPRYLKGKFVTDLSPTDLICDLPYDCPNNCTCIFRPATKEVVVDCDEMPTKLPFINLRQYPLSSYPDYRYTLHLKTQPNSLVDLNIYTLNLSSTNLHNITMKSNKHLKILDISNNNVNMIPDAFLKTNITLYVADNPLECNCALVKELKEYRVGDYKLARCADGRELSTIDVGRLCAWRMILTGYIVMAIIAGIFLTKLGFSVYRDTKQKRMAITRILFRRGSEYSIQMETRLDMTKDYDLFISFAHQDTQFVREELLPKLENKFNQKVCIHDRDWIAGELIEEQIVQSVESARRTIIILTEAFILSEWSYLEFRTAHNMSIREGRPRVIIILLDKEIVNDVRLSKAIKSYTLVNTYLVWGEPDFWNKLKRILPKHRRR